MTHNGTHLEASDHFDSTMTKAEKSITIDEAPLDWCIQNRVKLDFRYFEDGYVVTAKMWKKSCIGLSITEFPRYRNRQYTGRLPIRL